MAKPKATQQDQPQQSVQLEEIYEAEALNPALEALYAEMGITGEVQAKVYISKLQKEGKEARVWEGSPDDYDLMAIAKQFGSGEYRVKIYVPSERGNPVIRGNNVFAIMLPPGEDAAIEARRSGQIAQPAQGLGNLSVADLSRMITEGIRAALPAQPAQPQINPMELMRTFAEVARSMTPPQPAQPQLNPLELLRFGAELVKDRETVDPIERGVNATGTDVFLKLIDKFAPMFGQVLTQGAQPQQQPALPAPSQPAPTVAHDPNAGTQPANSQHPAQPVQLSPEEQEMTMRVKMGLSFLKMQAQADNDPGPYASMVVDNVPEATLKELLEAEKPLEILARFDPEILQHSDWFNELIAAVKEELTAPDVEETPQPANADQA